MLHSSVAQSAWLNLSLTIQSSLMHCEYAVLFEDDDFAEEILLDLHKIKIGLQAPGMYFPNSHRVFSSFPDMIQQHLSRNRRFIHMQAVH